MEKPTTKPTENKMGVMSVHKLLLTMSIPMMISMMVQACYNIVDSVFVAHISENALTAVSLAFPLQMLMICVGIGTGVGTNALLSKSLGEKNFERANKTATNGIFLSWMSCFAFMIIAFFVAEIFFRTQTNNEEIITYGRDYLLIVCLCSFGVFNQISFERLLLSTGKTFYAMISQSTGAIINIILNPILVFGLWGFPRLEVRGSALATVIGQSVAALLALYLNVKKNNEISLSMKGFRPSGQIIKRIYSVGIPSILMASVGSIMIYGLNRILITFTETATAVVGVYFKLQSFVFMPVFGLNNATVPILAYNYGARKKERIRKVVQLSVMYAVGIMLLGFTVFQLFPGKLLMLFNANEQMLAIGIPALRIISISFLFAGFCIVFISLFQALGNGMASLFVSVARQLIVLLPAAWLLSLSGSVNAIWWAFPLAELVTVILSALIVRNIYNTKIKVLS